MKNQKGEDKTVSDEEFNKFMRGDDDTGLPEEKDEMRTFCEKRNIEFPSTVDGINQLRKRMQAVGML